jgi:cytochrome c-type biogenesis protein CcmH/NrfG
MLMRIREQKGVIRLIFFALIIVFAASFVIGGVGSGSNFSLSDIIGNGSSASPSSTTNSGSVSDLQKQLKTHPKSASLWAQLSEAYSTNSDTENAISAGEKAVKLAPTNTTNIKTLASLYQTKANALNSQAQSLYNEAYTLQQQSPDSSPFSGGTGTLATATQDPFTQAQSEQYSVQISSLETKSQSYATQAISWDNKALAQYKAIVDRHVNDAQSWLSYATTAEQVGNNKAALIGYQTFLKLVPADPISPQVKTRVATIKKTIAKQAAAAKTSTTTTPSSTTTTSTTSTSGG